MIKNLKIKYKSLFFIFGIFTLTILTVPDILNKLEYPDNNDGDREDTIAFLMKKYLCENTNGAFYTKMLNAVYKINDQYFDKLCEIYLKEAC